MRGPRKEVALRVRLDAALGAQIKAEAKDRGMTISQVVRERLEVRSLPLVIPMTPAPHAHLFGAASSAGIRKCACGKVAM